MLELPCYVWVSICYRFRSWGGRRVPKRGAVLIVANHQSFLDPILLGVAAHHRPCHAMARASLFRSRFFGWLIRSLRAIPIELGAGDVKALRRCLEVLRAGDALVVYPEGSRTEDGNVAPFAAGTLLLIRKARPIVVPAAIEGAAAAWPRSSAWPRPAGRIGVMFGRPIAAEQLVAMEVDEALEHLRERVDTLRAELGGRLAKAGGREFRVPGSGEEGFRVQEKKGSGFRVGA